MTSSRAGLQFSNSCGSFLSIFVATTRRDLVTVSASSRPSQLSAVAADSSRCFIRHQPGTQSVKQLFYAITHQTDLLTPAQTSFHGAGWRTKMPFKAVIRRFPPVLELLIVPAHFFKNF